MVRLRDEKVNLFREIPPEQSNCLSSRDPWFKAIFFYHIYVSELKTNGPHFVCPSKFPWSISSLGESTCRQGHDCRFIAADSAPGLEGITSIRYRPPVDAKQLSCHPWAKDLATKAIRGECVARLLINLVKSGWTPDLIIGHPGWGELLVVKDILPNVPVWHQMEFFYSLNGADYNFDPEFRQNDWFSSSQLRLRRAPQLLALEDRLLSPQPSGRLPQLQMYTRIEFM